MTIELNQLTEGGYPGFVYSAEASDLRIPPGQMPKKLDVNGLGNGQAFFLTNWNDERFVYRQALGVLSIKVWND